MLLINYYICFFIVLFLTTFIGYTTKHETSKGNSLLKSMLANQINLKDMWKIFINLLNLKEQGAMEMCDIILGHHLYQFDTGHIFINTNTDAKRFRFLKSKEELKKIANDNAYENNWIDQYYPNRSNDLNEYSLLNIMTHFDVIFF